MEEPIRVLVIVLVGDASAEISAAQGNMIEGKVQELVNTNIAPKGKPYWFDIGFCMDGANEGLRNIIGNFMSTNKDRTRIILDYRANSGFIRVLSDAYTKCANNMNEWKYDVIIRIDLSNGHSWDPNNMVELASLGADGFAFRSTRYDYPYNIDPSTYNSNITSFINNIIKMDVDGRTIVVKDYNIIIAYYFMIFEMANVAFNREAISLLAGWIESVSSNLVNGLDSSGGKVFRAPLTAGFDLMVILFMMANRSNAEVINQVNDINQGNGKITVRGCDNSHLYENNTRLDKMRFRASSVLLLLEKNGLIKSNNSNMIQSSFEKIYPDNPHTSHNPHNP